jgi:hypothetical protein
VSAVGSTTSRPVRALLRATLVVAGVVVLCGGVGRAQSRARSAKPPAQPFGKLATLMAPVATAEQVLWDRLQAIADGRAKAVAKDYKATYRLASSMPGANRPLALASDTRRANWESVRADIAAWTSALNKEQQLLMRVTELDSLTIADVVVDLVQQLVHNPGLVAQREQDLQAARAALASAEASPADKDAAKFARIRVEARSATVAALRQFQQTGDAMLNALEQGGPPAYQARHAVWVEGGRVAARERQEALEQTAETFSRAIAETVTGFARATLEADRIRAERRQRAKLADPNYDRIMEQTRQAWRDACEAQGGSFTDGAGDDPGRCVY